MTPEQAFEKWWDKYEAWPEDGLDTHVLQAFLAGHQFQETNQLMVLADIRKAVGDGEGRLTQEELVKRIEGLANGWMPLSVALMDESNVLIAKISDGVVQDVLNGHFEFLAEDEEDGPWDIVNGESRCTYEGRRAGVYFCHWLPGGEWETRWKIDYAWYTHWMPLPTGPVKSVTTEKEEA